MKEGNKKIARILGIRLYTILKRLKFRFIYHTYFSSLLQAEHSLLDARAAFLSTFIKQDDLCFDIGANVGNRVGPLLQLGAKVVAVEPQELCAKFLTTHFGQQIRVVRNAVGSVEGKATMHLCDETTISSLSVEWINAVKENRFKHNTWDRTQTVRVTTLDRLIETYGKPQYIKIDVEGYELDVLKGLTQKIDVISYEYTVPELLARAAACLLECKRISPAALCNYTVGENTAFALESWLPVDDMLVYINGSAFVTTNFGDIYVKNNAIQMTSSLPD